MPSSADRYVPSCKIALGGSPLGTDSTAALVAVEVDLDVDLFGQCTLLFHDPQLRLINANDFAAGVAVRVELGFDSRRAALFEGEVVALEPHFRRDLPPSLRVVCQEPLHRLALSQSTRSFNNVDDKEIVTLIAREHGLSAEAPAGSKAHHLQSNVSDAVLLRRLAQKQGNHLRIEGTKLIVGPPPKGPRVTVGPGSGISRAKVRINANSQVSEITVHGWDAAQKREITGKARPQGATGEGGQKYGGGAVLSFAAHEVMPVDPATADAMAKGRLRRIAEGFVTAEVEMLGDPQLLPGAEVKIEKVEAELDGTWRVEHASHRFDKHGYRVRFRAVRTARVKPPAYKAPPAAAPQREPPPPDVHLIVLQVKSIGGTVLAGHQVRLLDERGRQVGDVLTTGAQGELRVQVPEKRNYRLEILDEDLGAPALQLHHDEPALLLCRFLDVNGGPVANEAVEARSGDDKRDLRTDGQGRLEAPVPLAAWELKVREHRFSAHAIPAADREKEENHYVFVLGEPADLHLIAVEVKGLGDTPLARHKVRVLDPETGEPLGEWLETDEAGILRTRVPDERTWRIEVSDEGFEAGTAQPNAPEAQGVLFCQFVDAQGRPIANEAVEAAVDGDKLDLRTDGSGRIEAPARLAACQLTIRGQAFTAHALTAADRGRDENLYRFVVEAR